VVQPPAGRLSDAVGRWPIVTGGVVLAVGGLLLLISNAALSGSVLALVGVGVAQAGYQPLLPDAVPGRNRGMASGLKSGIDVAGATVGFLLLAALLSEGASIAATLILVAALAVPFAIAFLLLPDRSARRRQAGRRSVGITGILDGTSSSLVALVAARFFFLLGIFGVGRFLLLFIADRLSLDADAAAAQAGAALGLLALVTVAASVPAGWLADRVGRRVLMLTGGIVAALGIGLLATANSVAMVVVFGALMALGSAAFGAASWAALTDLTPSADAGRLLGLANLGTAGAAAAAGAFGLLIDAGNVGGGQFGYAVAFGLAAASALVGGSLAWRSVPTASFASTRLAEVPR
jgi:MFS family permease